MRTTGLASIFRNQDEQFEPVQATIEGTIPQWINGRYLRVGPGKFDIGDTTMKHFIDGYAMVTKFEIQKGVVKFSKRYLESDAYKKAIAAKKPILPEFSTKGNPGEGKSFINRVLGAFGSSGITDNDVVNLYSIAGKVFTASETCHVHNVCPNDLSTCDNKIDFYKYFGIYMATAHPLLCPKTGDLYNIGTSFKPSLKYQIFKIPQLNGASVKETIKKSEVIATIYPSWNTCISYYHSFAMTENYIIMLEQPLLMNVIKLAEAKMMGKGIRDAQEWTPTEKTRFHIVDKRTGEVFKTKYYSENPFFFFHIPNSFEDRYGNIVIDIDAYDSDQVMEKMSLDRLRKEDVNAENPAHLQRYVLPIIKNIKDASKHINLIGESATTTSASAYRDDNNSIVLSCEEIGEPGFEGPIVNPNFLTKKHRYIYGTGTCFPGFYANSLCKLDTATGTVKLWKDNRTTYPGEPVFLPCSNSTSEDSEDTGILMTAVSESEIGKRDYLVFLDSKTMEEVGRATVPIQIPQAIHGIFLETES